MASYLSCGNIMSDEIVQPDGKVSSRHMGGPAFYALSGMRLWCDDCKLVTQTGEDYQQDYAKWLDANDISKDAVRIEAEHVSCYHITYDDKGRSVPEKSFSYYGDRNMGYLKTHPRPIEKAATPSTKGIYMAQGVDLVVWEKLNAIKQKFGFKIMWELEYFNSGNDMQKVTSILPYTDAWSLNQHEAAGLLKLAPENETEILRQLQSLPVPFTFYRVGKRGAYAISPHDIFYCPPVDAGPYVDQTGCGNSSTGAAMFALFAGYSPADTLVMANIASGFNCLQYGPYPLYTPAVREKALALKETYASKVEQVL